MKKLALLGAIICGVFAASVYAADFSLTGLVSSQLHFTYHGNQFGGTIFFRDLKDVSETLMCNNIPKACTKQIR